MFEKPPVAPLPVSRLIVVGHDLVERRDDVARIDLVVLDRIFRLVLEVADELLLHFRRAIAGLLEVLLRERRVERFDAELRVGLDVDVGRARVAHQHVRLGVEVHELRVRIEIAVLGRVAVQARADADHDVGFLEELDRGLGRVQAGDADVVRVLLESQVFAMSEVAISAPVRSASLRIASPAPDQLAPRPATITGFLAVAMTSSARLQRVRHPGPTRAAAGASTTAGTDRRRPNFFCCTSIGQLSMTGRDSSCAM